MLPYGHSCKGSTTHCASIFWNHTRKQVKKHYTKNGQTVQIISAKVANPLPVIFTLCPKNWVETRNDDKTSVIAKGVKQSDDESDLCVSCNDE